MQKLNDTAYIILNHKNKVPKRANQMENEIKPLTEAEIIQKRKTLTGLVLAAKQKLFDDPKIENVQANMIAYNVHKDALLIFEQSLLTPEQLMAQERYDTARAKRIELENTENEAWELLIKVMPNAVRKGTPKVSSGERQSVATVSMTAELKEKVIQMAKEGKRNIDIQKETGLNNGQISPILQKAGLTKPKNAA